MSRPSSTITARSDTGGGCQFARHVERTCRAGLSGVDETFRSRSTSAKVDVLSSQFGPGNRADHLCGESSGAHLLDLGSSCPPGEKEGTAYASFAPPGTRGPPRAGQKNGA